MNWTEIDKSNKSNPDFKHTSLHCDNLRIESICGFSKLNHGTIQQDSAAYAELLKDNQIVKHLQVYPNSKFYQDIAKEYSPNILENEDVFKKLVMTALAEATESLVEYAEKNYAPPRNIFKLTKNWSAIHLWNGDTYLISPDEPVLISTPDGFKEIKANDLNYNDKFKFDKDSEEMKVLTHKKIFINKTDNAALQTLADKTETPTAEPPQEFLYVYTESFGPNPQRSTHRVPMDKMVFVQGKEFPHPEEIKASDLSKQKVEAALLGGSWQKIISIQEPHDYYGPIRRITTKSHGTYEFPYLYQLKTRAIKKFKDLKIGDIIQVEGQEYKVSNVSPPQIDWKVEIQYRPIEGGENKTVMEYRHKTFDMDLKVFAIQSLPVHAINAVSNLEVLIGKHWVGPEIYNYEDKDEYIRRTIIETEDGKCHNVSDTFLQSATPPYLTEENSMEGSKIKNWFKVHNMNHLNL